MKKFIQVIFITLALCLFAPSLVVESSSLNNNVVSNITRGSSLSLNDTSTPYWLSPSGNIAFGFYLLPCKRSSLNCSDRYVVGIWFVKSSKKTLVWSATLNDLPLRKPSSILFTDEGKLVLRRTQDGYKDRLLLPDVAEPASHAKLHDNGNFVLYGSDNQIVWESFDYPTDTILGGQKLRPGVDLISGDYRLSVKQTNGFVAIYKKETDNYQLDGPNDYFVERWSSVSGALYEDSLSEPVTLRLDVTGTLYLADSDDKAIKVLYQPKQQVTEEERDYHIYRATLSSKGRFDLQKERIDGNGDSLDNNWNSSSSSNIVWSSSHNTMSALVAAGVILLLVALFATIKTK